jgi:hypothetical protein
MRLVCWGLEKSLETGTFLHRGLIKNHEGGSIHQELCEIFERGLWRRGISLYGPSVEGTGRGGSSFTGNPEGYVEESSGDVHLSIGVPLGNW